MYLVGLIHKQTYFILTYLLATTIAIFSKYLFQVDFSLLSLHQLQTHIFSLQHHHVYLGFSV
jgi:hypothetical protein